MAKSLGIDLNSPSLCFTTTKKRGLSERNGNSVKRSIRRTTMLHPELDQSLREIKSKSVRRSIRISNLQNENSPKIMTHALEEKKAWKVSNQKAHNQQILNILNSGNLKILQTLPGIGPKTAIGLHSYRY